MKNWKLSDLIVPALIGTVMLSAFYLVRWVKPSPAYSSYVLQDGTHVRCSWETWDACGMTLKDCSDGKTYECQINLTKKRLSE